MSENNKAFTEGWRMATQHPSVSPDLIKALGKVIADYFERDDLREYLGGVVCDSRSESTRFAVSYTLLPFTLLHFHMNAEFYRRPEVIAFTNDLIGTYLEQLFTRRGKVRLGDYLISDIEIQIAHNEFTRHFKNANVSVPALQDIEVDYVELISFFFACRTRHLRQLFTRAFTATTNDEPNLREMFKKLTISYGEEFVRYSTSRLTGDKTSAAAKQIGAIMSDFINATRKHNKN